MVDIDKIKPGDAVVLTEDVWYYKLDGASTQFASGVVVKPIKKGTVLTVASPPFKLGGRDAIRVVVDDSADGGIVEVYRAFLEPSEPARGPQAECVCDILSLMRVGCRCGFLAREREAARG